jgi:hypothetical protein
VNKWSNDSRLFVNSGLGVRWPEYHELLDTRLMPRQIHAQYLQRRDWIYDNVENCVKHARWSVSYADHSISVKFRREADLLRYILRWA